ncbi:MAG TPA: YCF48-related protein [Pyrinomonadaceae bacterium]|nr:YCF48-related protein [Pyrinomonadaceae bacterium]
MTIPLRIGIAVTVSCSVVLGFLFCVNSDRQLPNVRVQFVNRDVGWIVGPRLLQTGDGGRTWKEVRSEGYGTLPSESIGFGHTQIQFITPASGVQLDLSKLVKTDDGGSTWLNHFPLPERRNPGGSSGSLFFLTPEVGWVVNEIVYRTTDGGRSWTELTATPRGVNERQRAMRIAPTLADFIPALWFVSEQVGLMARRDGEVYRTGDGGTTWTKVLTVESSIRNIFFVNNQKGWVTGDRGFIARTTDGGLTWSKEPVPTSADLTCIFFINEQTGWVVGLGSTILYTRDGGLTWKNGSVSGLIRRPPLASVSFADERHGWAVGGYGQPFSVSLFGPSNVILSTSDGGHTWQSVAP